MKQKLRTARQHHTLALTAIAEHIKGIIHYPTGSGKGFIITRAIIQDIENRKKLNLPPTVYCILSPRILLSNQLFAEVQQDLFLSQIHCQYLIVHSDAQSGKHAENAWDEAVRQDNAIRDNVPFIQIKASCLVKDVELEYIKSVKEQIPLIISGTYDSACRISGHIPVHQLHCDEAHYLVSGSTKKFGWIPKDFESEQKFFYTATLKNTTQLTNKSFGQIKKDSRKVGRGMNNIDLFGPIIARVSAAELVTQGDIIKPRIHLVHMDSVDHDGTNKDVAAIISSYNEHVKHCSIGAKMLVVTKGSNHMKEILTHDDMKKFRIKHPELYIFDTSSAFKPRINGEVVSFGKFLKELRRVGNDDNAQAIIFHIRQLREGIDVPGITGVMFFDFGDITSALQNLGRATRLHILDRLKLRNGEMTTSELDKFIKPYAWVIIPTYGETGDELRPLIENLVVKLRDTGFCPMEDVIISEPAGIKPDDPIPGINIPDTLTKNIFDTVGDIHHEIEQTELLIQQRIELNTIHNMSLEDTFDFLNSLG